jgi:hypothetical protein
MTEHLDARGNWVRQRTFELQQSGLSYDDAHTRAEAEADVEFESEDGNGDGATA